MKTTPVFNLYLGRPCTQCSGTRRANHAKSREVRLPCRRRWSTATPSRESRGSFAWRGAPPAAWLPEGAGGPPVVREIVSTKNRRTTFVCERIFLEKEDHRTSLFLACVAAWVCAGYRKFWLHAHIYSHACNMHGYTTRPCVHAHTHTRTLAHIHKCTSTHLAGHEAGSRNQHPAQVFPLSPPPPAIGTVLRENLFLFMLSL